MKFIDEIIIKVFSGNGGNGCISFKKERFVTKGRPDGGDGGDGGNVVLRSSLKRKTLQHLRFKKEYKANTGENGKNKNKKGKSGNNIIIKVPVGTTVFDSNSGKLLYEFYSKNDNFIIANGGKGGDGNRKFISSRSRSPKICQAGIPGAKITIKLPIDI